MLVENLSQVEFLKQVLIFNEFSEDELEIVARRLNTEFVKAGEVIFSQGEIPGNIYFVFDGELELQQPSNWENPNFQTYYHYGDIFGEDDLYFDRSRSTTVVAMTDTELRYLSKEDFTWLRNTFPKVEPYLNAIFRTRDIVSRLNIKWLNEREKISLADRRHPIVLIMGLLLVLFFVFLFITISIALITFIKDVYLITVLSAGVGGVVGLVGLITGIGLYYEWRNDYFFITNIRVVWRERLLLRTSSRQEVPLRRIQSLDIETSHFLERILGVGDVIIRTFNSEMRLTQVKFPARMKNMVDAYMKQAQRKFIRSEQAAIRYIIRRKLEGKDEEQQLEPTPLPLKVQKSPNRLSVFNSRVVENESITYRKHWLVFLRAAWKPSMALCLTIVAVISASGFVFQTFGLVFLLPLLLFLFMIFFWWLYAYADWRNDIYIVTKERIIDRDKKPFGKESFRSAPIQNIQSVGHEIPNIIGLLLNVGNIRINVGEEILTFNGVHNPALVHQDISRHMEEHAANLEREHIKQEHARMATWLDIYHDETRRDINKDHTEHIPDFD